MVLMPVGEHYRDDIVEPVFYCSEVREDEVDAGLIVFWEEHAAVNDEQAAVNLEDGHIAPDFPQPTQRDNPQGVVSQGWGCRQVRKCGSHGLILRTLGKL